MLIESEFYFILNIFLNVVVYQLMDRGKLKFALKIHVFTKQSDVRGKLI